jgi:hypothetical protein
VPFGKVHIKCLNIMDKASTNESRFPQSSHCKKLCQKALEFINNFNMMNVENKFIELMNCDKIQIMLAHTLHIFFTRRKRFLWSLMNIFLSSQLMIVPHSEITPLYVWWFVEADMIRNVRLLNGSLIKTISSQFVPVI